MSRKRLLQKIFFAGVLSTLSVLNVVAGGPDDVANVAERQIGVRRAEGSAATTPERGFDCSGLTLYCYRHGAGIEIGRTTQDQRHRGRIVGREGLHRGDLVFFCPGWSHVGIYAGDGKVIHSSSSAKKVVKATIWKDFVGGVKVIEHVPRPVPVPVPHVDHRGQFVKHAGTQFTSTIRQDGCSGRDPHNHLCVDADAGGNGTVNLWDFAQGANQTWDFIPANDGPDVYFIGSEAKFLNGGNAFLTSYPDGRLRYEPFRRAKEQEWHFVELRPRHWLIQNVGTGRYLDSGPHGNHRNGGNVYTNVRCGAEQEWTLK